VKIEISGKTLREALEHGVSRSGVGEDSEPGRFPQVSGLTFTWDASKPAGSRIVMASVGGVPLLPTGTYKIATSNFLVANGGDGYVMFKEGKVLTDPATAPKDSDVFEAAIRKAPAATIAPTVEGRIKRLN
jgi:5'-nucleotidase